MRIVFARDTFISGHVVVVAGSHWNASDPLVQSHPALFTDDLTFGMSSSTGPVEHTERTERKVEQTTAAPGERRTRTRGD